MTVILGTGFEEARSRGIAVFFGLPFLDNPDGFVEIVDVFEIHFHKVDVFFEYCGDGITCHARGIGMTSIPLLIGGLDQSWEKKVLVKVKEDFDVSEDDAGVIRRSMWGYNIVNVYLKSDSCDWGKRTSTSSCNPRM